MIARLEKFIERTPFGGPERPAKRIQITERAAALGRPESVQRSRAGQEGREA
jgi:hypothetical protein